MNVDEEIVGTGYGDSRFVGVNMRLKPDELEPGFVALAVNRRFDRGRAETRRGVMKLGWSNRLSGSTVTPYGVVHGVGVYGDFNGTEWILVAADGVVYRCREGMASSVVGLPAGVVLAGEVSFTQVGHAVVLFRGEEEDGLVMRSLDVGFVPVSQADVAGAAETGVAGTELMPRGEAGEAFQNRLLVAHGRDLVAVSDVLDYSRYAPSTGAYRLHQGSQDRLVRLFAFNRSTVLGFKEGSVLSIGNLVPNGVGQFDQATLELVTSQYGLRGRRAAVRVGQDVWFLADRRGVVSVGQTEEGRLKGVDLPLSDALQPVIDRINWLAAGGACAAEWNNRVYFAVPLDEGEVLKASLVPVLGATYDAQGRYTVTGLKVGRMYRFTPGPNEVRLVNGTVELSGKGDFTAVGTSVQVLSAAGSAADVNFADDFNGENGGVGALSYSGWGSWDVVNGPVDLVSGGSSWNPYSSQGGYVALVGAGGVSSPLGTIRSKDEFLLALGVSYRLTVRYAGSGVYGCNGELRFEVGSLSNELVAVSAGTGWTTYTKDVVGDGGSHKVTITGTQYAVPSYRVGPVVDEVVFANLGSAGAKGVTCLVEPLFSEVNNAVLVFDLVNGAWAGYDEAQSSKPSAVFGTTNLLATQYGGGYGSTGGKSVTVVPGRRYRLTRGTSETQVVNGGVTWAGPVVEFMAATSTVTVTVTGLTVTGSLVEATGWVDNASAVMVREWFKHRYQGVERLFFVSGDGFLNLYEEGFDDQVATNADVVGHVDIGDRLVTRGYMLGTDRVKGFDGVGLQLLSWNPKWTVKVRVDGVEEVKVVKSGEERSRTRYAKPFWKAAYDTTNVNDDFFVAGREDYSWNPGSTEVTFLDGVGIDPDLHQEFERWYSVRQEGRYLQVELLGTRGRVGVSGVLVRGNGRDERGGVRM